MKATIRAVGEVGNLGEMSLSAKIIRCGCGHPERHRGKVCPKPRRIEDKGELAYWHKSFWRRTWWRTKRRLSAIFIGA